MKAGTAISILAQPGRPDAALYHEHMALGDLAEPLGFDSLFALEHHFTGYSMSPAPLQLLSYYAVRTHKITLGTCVIVLPWHDPIRVAEQIALLDVLSGGRTLMGFGRGAATTEYEGFRIPMGEARGRFLESAQLIIKALSNDSFEWQGALSNPPTRSGRADFASGAAVPCLSGQWNSGIDGETWLWHVDRDADEWPKAAEDAPLLRDHAGVGHTPKPPIILMNVACAQRKKRGHAASASSGSIDNHYHFSDGHLSNERLQFAGSWRSLFEDEGSLLAQGHGFLREHPDRWHAG